jgi:hypothetical protein
MFSPPPPTTQKRVLEPVSSRTYSCFQPPRSSGGAFSLISSHPHFARTSAPQRRCAASASPCPPPTPPMRERSSRHACSARASTAPSPTLERTASSSSSDSSSRVLEIAMCREFALPPLLCEVLRPTTPWATTRVPRHPCSSHVLLSGGRCAVRCCAQPSQAASSAPRPRAAASVAALRGTAALPRQSSRSLDLD